MEERSSEVIQDSHLDLLQEIGNIGAGNATTALASMLRVKIDMNVPKVELLDFRELPEVLGGAENIVAGILLMLHQDVEGMMMFAMERDAAHSIVDILLGQENSAHEEFNEIESSALQEVGNIITGAYLNSLSGLTGLKIEPSIPYISIDMAGAILSVPAIEFGKVGDKALLIQTEFGQKEAQINGYFILIPTMESSDKIMKSLGL